MFLPTPLLSHPPPLLQPPPHRYRHQRHLHHITNTPSPPLLLLLLSPSPSHDYYYCLHLYRAIDAPIASTIASAIAPPQLLPPPLHYHQPHYHLHYLRYYYRYLQHHHVFKKLWNTQHVYNLKIKKMLKLFSIFKNRKTKVTPNIPYTQ